MTRRWVRWAAQLTLGALLAISAARPAAGDTRAVPDTVVTTRDGAVYQGVLVEQVPGDHVTIQTADGRIHTFAAAQVASVHPLRARPAMPPVEPLANGATSVLVDLTATDPNARLVQVSVTGNAVAAPNPEICAPPCGVHVAPGNYLIGGPGIVPSAGFQLSGNPNHVHVTSDVLTTDHRGTSQFLMIGGGIGAATVGVPLWLGGYLFESFGKTEQASGFSNSSQATSTGQTLEWIGISVTALCVVAAITGFAIYRGDTIVRVDPGS